MLLQHTDVCGRTCDVCRITFPDVKTYEEVRPCLDLCTIILIAASQHWKDRHGKHKQRQARPHRAVNRSFPLNTSQRRDKGNEAFRRDPSSQKHVDLKLPFGCFDCPLRCASTRRLVNHCKEMGHRRFWPCVSCMIAFPSKEELSQVRLHQRFAIRQTLTVFGRKHRIELDVPAHRHCRIAPCDTLFSTIELYQAVRTPFYTVLMSINLGTGSTIARITSSCLPSSLRKPED